MAYFETPIQIDTEVDILLEISARDSYTGQALDCDVDGVGQDIEVTVDTSDLRDEIKQEFREDLREELVLEIKEEIIESIARDSNPFAKLAAFVNSIDSPHKRSVDSRIDNATLSFGKTLEKQTNIEIEQLKEHIKKLEKELDHFNTPTSKPEGEEKEEMSLGEKKMTVSLLPPQPAFTITPGPTKSTNKTEEK